MYRKFTIFLYQKILIDTMTKLKTKKKRNSQKALLSNTTHAGLSVDTHTELSVSPQIPDAIIFRPDIEDKKKIIHTKDRSGVKSNSEVLRMGLKKISDSL